MLKKIIVGVLLISVLGAGGAALANQAAQPQEASVAPNAIDVSLEPVEAGPIPGEPIVMAEENMGEGICQLLYAWN